MHTIPGGIFSFSKTEIEVCRYLSIHKKHVIAFQIKTEFVKGDCPFYSLPGIGGSELMRGLLRDRYIDKTSAAGQVEYRFPLWWIFAGSLFTAAGQVQPSISDYNISDTQITGGAGLRIILDREKHIAARLDIGIDMHGRPALYFLVKEAF